ncbi:MAG: GNAT family N-acetyltransferase, partial [Myxococcales bacterium]|nr:GNAT family N-acetyltransferase [Myxococcales bacterium]
MLIRDAQVEDAEAMGRVEVVTWQESYRGILPERSLASMSVARSSARWLHVLG